MSYSLKTPGNADGRYSYIELEDMTISEIKSLADSLGYSIEATRKGDIIAEFLAQNGA